MKKRQWSMGVVVLGAVALLACSSSTSGGGSTSNAACVEASSPSPACYSCGQSKCGSQLSTIESACSTYLTCVCPGGTFNSNDVASCSASISTACTNAEDGLNTCIDQSCTSECNQNDGG